MPLFETMTSIILLLIWFPRTVPIFEPGEGKSRLGVAHISRFILQNAWYSYKWSRYQSPVFPGVYTQSVIHYLVYGKPKWKHGLAIVLLQDLVHKLGKGELSFLFSGTSCLSEDPNFIPPCKFTLFTGGVWFYRGNWQEDQILLCLGLAQRRITEPNLLIEEWWQRSRL